MFSHLLLGDSVSTDSVSRPMPLPHCFPEVNLGAFPKETCRRWMKTLTEQAELDVEGPTQGAKRVAMVSFPPSRASRPRGRNLVRDVSEMLGVPLETALFALWYMMNDVSVEKEYNIKNLGLEIHHVGDRGPEAFALFFSLRFLVN